MPNVPPKPSKSVMTANKFKEPPFPINWDVGERIGAAIRKYKEEKEKGDGVGTGFQSAKRPHIRRAHWHRFGTGKGRQKIVVKWLHPMFVNVDAGDLPVTIRKVE